METKIRLGNIISLAMQKGGVGKTTTTKNLGKDLADLGYKVLLVDDDAQGSLTKVSVNAIALSQSGNPTMFDIYVNGAKMNDIIVPVSENLDLAPALINLSKAEISLTNAISRESFLKRSLASIRNQYDFILIDCPPSLGLLTLNALNASDFVVFIVQLEYFALQGVELLEDTVQEVTEALNPNLVTIGVLETMNDNTNHTTDVSEQIKNLKKYKNLGVVDRSTDVRDAIMYKESISEYKPTHKVAIQYKEFAENLVSEINSFRKGQ